MHGFNWTVCWTITLEVGARNVQEMCEASPTPLVITEDSSQGLDLDCTTRKAIHISAAIAEKRGEDIFFLLLLQKPGLL